MHAQNKTNEQKTHIHTKTPKPAVYLFLQRPDSQLQSWQKAPS